MQLDVDLAVYNILCPSILLCTSTSAFGVLTPTDTNRRRLHYECSVITQVTFKLDQRHFWSSWPTGLPQNITVVVLPLTQYFVYYDRQIKAELHRQVVGHVEEGRKKFVHG